eukprot:jgi/Bigna1/139159/aug1.49_g13867
MVVERRNSITLRYLLLLVAYMYRASAAANRNNNNDRDEPPVAVKNPSLTWNGIEVHIGKRQILDLKFGFARPGKLLGIMGPSGCGKTTMLNCLAQSLPKIEGQKLKGDVKLTDGRKLSLDSGEVMMISLLENRKKEGEEG